MPKAAQLSTLPKTVEAPSVILRVVVQSHPYTQVAAADSPTAYKWPQTDCDEWWASQLAGPFFHLSYFLCRYRSRICDGKKEETKVGRCWKDDWRCYTNPAKSWKWITMVIIHRRNANLFLSLLSMWCYFWQWRPGNQDEPVRYSAAQQSWQTSTLLKLNAKYPILYLMTSASFRLQRIKDSIIFIFD